MTRKSRSKPPRQPPRDAGAASAPGGPGPSCGSPGDEPGAVRPLAAWIEIIALWLVLMVVAMRPMLSETYDAARHAIAQALDQRDTTTPGTTAWLNLLIWLTAFGTAVSRAMRRERWQWTGMEIGAVVLAGAAFVSSMAASNTRLAINASFDWLGAVALGMVVANLCRDRLRIALVLAVLAASGMASAARCGTQVLYEFEQTRQVYEEHREAFWARQGVPLDDPRVTLYERRLDARQASGFFPHSNVQGSWLSLAGFAILAAAALGRERWLHAVGGAGAVALWATILTTGSRGAVGGTVAAIGLWCLLRAVPDRLRARWPRVLAAFWGFVAAGVIGVLVVGLTRGGLPGASLDFRWNYWRTTQNMIADHPWTGVGALNFDRVYVQYKPIESPEEIKDPHNFVMSVLSQWGLPGGIGLVLLLVGASAVTARRWGQHHALRLDDGNGEPRAWDERTLRRWIVACVLGFLLWRVWLLRDWWFGVEAGVALLVLDLGQYGLAWIIVFTGLIWMLRRAQPDAEERMRRFVLCGIGAFLIHNLIEFAMFYPGALTPFAAMAGVLLAAPDRAPHGGPDPRRAVNARHNADARGTGGTPAVATRSPSRLLTLVPCLVFAVASIAFLAVMFVPVTRASSLLTAARTSPDDASIHLYRTAADVDRLDPAPLAELTERLTRTGRPEHLQQAVEAITEAVERDPLDTGLHRRHMQLRLLRYGVVGDDADLTAAIEAGRRVIELYPASPDAHRELANILGGAARERKSAELAAAAIRHYREALALDAARPGVEELRRWPESWREGLREEIAELEQLADGPDGA